MGLVHTWHRLLLIFAVLHVIVWYSNRGGHRRRPVPNLGLWGRLWYGHRDLLVGLYVLACALRSALPRQDGDRVCMYRHPLSSPWVGRVVACVGEIAFVLLCLSGFVVMYDHQPIPQCIASACLLLILLAEAFCVHGVVYRRDQSHAVEMTLWAIATGVVMVYCTLAPPATNTERIPHFRTSVMAMGCLYVTYLVQWDIPMYRQRAALHRDDDPLPLPMSCQRWSSDWEVWHHEMPWMTLYFLCAVWFALWLQTC